MFENRDRHGSPARRKTNFFDPANNRLVAIFQYYVNMIALSLGHDAIFSFEHQLEQFLANAREVEQQQRILMELEAHPIQRHPSIRFLDHLDLKSLNEHFSITPTAPLA